MGKTILYTIIIITFIVLLAVFLHWLEKQHQSHYDEKKIVVPKEQRTFTYVLGSEGDKPASEAFERLQADGWQSVREIQLSPGAVLMILERPIKVD